MSDGLSGLPLAAGVATERDPVRKDGGHPTKTTGYTTVTLTPTLTLNQGGGRDEDWNMERGEGA